MCSPIQTDQTWRASPIVKNFNRMLAKTQIMDQWKKIRQPKKDCVIANRALRKQLRQEKSNDQKHFYNELMQNPSTAKFYQLIRKNRGSTGQKTSSIIIE